MLVSSERRFKDICLQRLSRWRIFFAKILQNEQISKTAIYFFVSIADSFALFSRNQVFNALKGAKNPSVAFEVATARDRGIVQQIYNLVSRQ